jgi:hypothetical protein
VHLACGPRSAAAGRTAIAPFAAPRKGVVVDGAVAAVLRRRGGAERAHRTARACDAVVAHPAARAELALGRTAFGVLPKRALQARGAVRVRVGSGAARAALKAAGCGNKAGCAKSAHREAR